MFSPEFRLTSAIRANKDSTIDHLKTYILLIVASLTPILLSETLFQEVWGSFNQISCVESTLSAQRFSLVWRSYYVFEIPTQPPPVDSPHHHAALAIFHLFRRSLYRVCAWTRRSSRQSQYCRDMEFRLPSCHYWSGESHLPFSSTQTDTQMPIVLYFQGFANPANMSFIYPKNSGVSYAL